MFKTSGFTGSPMLRECWNCNAEEWHYCLNVSLPMYVHSGLCWMLKRACLWVSLAACFTWAVTWGAFQMSRLAGMRLWLLITPKTLRWAKDEVWSWFVLRSILHLWGAKSKYIDGFSAAGKLLDSGIAPIGVTIWMPSVGKLNAQIFTRDHYWVKRRPSGSLVHRA